jgi:hypothetical protein
MAELVGLSLVWKLSLLAAADLAHPGRFSAFLKRRTSAVGAHPAGLGMAEDEIFVALVVALSVGLLAGREATHRSASARALPTA